ncbi:MAG: response regulator [Desulfobacterales bacterium]|nr:response regulator [Desulfobacterales bacterium]
MNTPAINETLLLVDDEPGIRKVLGISLADVGYHVLTAESGEEALAKFREHYPPIVLTDIKMPGMDGIELLKIIKNENPDTEVIMITGHGDMELAIKSLKFEATDFVTKPIRDDILSIALKRARDRITMRGKLRAYTENLERLVAEKSARLIEAERQVAVGQTIEGLVRAFSDIAGDLNGGIRYFNDMPCYVSIHSRDFEIVAANQLFRERIGDKIGHKSWEIYQGDSKTRPCPVEDTFQTGMGRRVKRSIQLAGGGVVPVMVHTAPIRNRNHEVELVLEISADITEMNRLQAELMTTRARYEQLFNEVPCYISVQDRQFQITDANKRFKEEFGEVAGGFCYKIYKHRDSPCPQCPVARTFEDGLSHSHETVVRSKTGDEYNVLIWTAPIRDEKAEVTQVMEMSTNITEVRQLEDHLSSLGLLIGSVSHAIKGLLTGLDGGMYQLGAGFAKQNEAKIKEGWETVRMMVDRIRRMMMDILYYAKERNLKWERTDVPSLVKDSLATLEKEIRDAGIGLSVNIDASLGDVDLDIGIIRSALSNIIENAIDACKIDTAKATHHISVAVRQDKKHIYFEVMDDGVGMDQTTQDSLFRTVHSTKGKRGTGLGLFMSSRIISQQGGLISVTSSPGIGSTFTIKMPKIPVRAQNMEMRSIKA